MKVKIIPPIMSGKSPYVKEFDNWKQVNAYLRAHNEKIYERDLKTIDSRTGEVIQEEIIDDEQKN